MAVEEVRARLRRRLVELVGMEEADVLMDRPPGGWDELVTKDWLHLELAVVHTRLDAIDGRMLGRMDALELRMAGLESRMDRFELRMDSFEQALRAQTWKMIAAMTGLLGALVAAVKL